MDLLHRIMIAALHLYRLDGFFKTVQTFGGEPRAMSRHYIA